jgi:hypothetical protein
MSLRIDGYDLITTRGAYVKKINNILVANCINAYCIQICARYNAMVACWMYAPFGVPLRIDGAIRDAVAAMQEKFGPDLPVQNNYALAKTLTPYKPAPFSCDARTRKIYGDLFDADLR